MTFTREQAYNNQPRKHAYIEWLTMQRKAWREYHNHDGELNTTERNESFDLWLKNHM